MDLQEYQKLAPRTESVVEHVECDKNELLHIFNTFIVAGKLLDCIKRKIYYNNSDRYDQNFSKHLNELDFFLTSLRRHHSEKMVETIDIDSRVLHAGLGIGSEASEVIEALEHAITHGSLDVVNFSEEIFGDLGWYQAIYADATGQSWEQGLENNINKLRVRYPEKYSDENAEHRDLESERKELEK